MAEIICPISGVRLTSAPYMLGFKLKELHPIFRAKRRDLLSNETDLVHSFRRAGEKGSAREELEEKRIIFLGLLFCTDLVSFTTIAYPSLKTIETSFEDVCQVARWIDFATYQVPKGIALPHYVVREENKDLSNIKVAFLDPIQEIRKAFLDKNKNREQGKLWQQEVDKMFKELNDAWKKDRFFTPHTVRWAFRFCELEDHPKARLWTEMLLVPTENAYGMNRDELVDLKETISEAFDHNHPTWEPFIGQLNQLIAAHARGSGDFEIIEVPQSYIDLETGEEGERMAPVGEVYQEKMLKTYGSMEEPLLKDFPTRQLWLKAKAIWWIATHNQPEKKEDKKEGGKGDV